MKTVHSRAFDQYNPSVIPLIFSASVFYPKVAWQNSCIVSLQLSADFLVIPKRLVGKDLPFFLPPQHSPSRHKNNLKKALVLRRVLLTPADVESRSTGESAFDSIGKM